MSPPGGHKTYLAILLVAVVVFSMLLRRSFFGAQPPRSDAPATVAVEVSGEVPSPGIYLVSRDRATVSNALLTAGLSGIEADGMRKLESGESLAVVKTENGFRVIAGQMQASARLALGLKIDVNSASEEDLMLVPQMRPEFAAAIVKGRIDRPWEKVEDLAQIHGIGPKTVQKFEEFLDASPRGRK